MIKVGSNIIEIRLLSIIYVIQISLIKNKSENDSLDRIHFLVLVIQRAGFYTHKGIASSSRFVLSNRPRMTSVGHLIHLPVPAANDVSRRVMQAWCDSQGRAASCRPDVTHRGGRAVREFVAHNARTQLANSLP